MQTEGSETGRGSDERQRWRSAIQTQPRAVIGCSGVWADVHVLGVLRYCTDAQVILRIAMIDWRMYGNPDKRGRRDQMDSVCRTNRWMILSFVRAHTYESAHPPTPSKYC